MVNDSTPFGRVGVFLIPGRNSISRVVHGETWAAQSVDHRFLIQPQSWIGEIPKCLSEALNGAAEKVFLILSGDSWIGPNYVSTILHALSRPGIVLAGFTKAHQYDVTSRSYDCLCNRRFATIDMLAFRRELTPTILQLCVRGKPDIAPALWKVVESGKELIPNKGPDGKLRCIGFSFEGDPLRRQDPQLKWLEGNVGAVKARQLIGERGRIPA